MPNTVARNITISINGKEVENSLNGVGREIGKLKGQLRNETFGSERFKELQEQLNATRGRYREMNDEVRNTAITADEARGALNNIFTGAVTGDPKLLAAGFSTITTNIKASTRALLAFVATPIGALLAIATAVVAGVKAWNDYNSSIREQIELTESITKLQGEQADNARLLASTIEQAYGSNFKETLTTARSLVNEFGVSYEEALQGIDEGLLRGGRTNEEYLDSLREYGTFFAQAGFSLIEFRDIVNTGFDLGIYTDKLPDAIKEFGISVSEQTKSTRDGFVNAFGEEFTDDLFQGVRDGTITIREALQQTAQESTKVSLTVQQNAQLTADAFRGAGEDAGGALKVLEAINRAYEEQNRVLTPLEETLKRNRDATEELARAQDEALKSDNYIALANNADVAWKQIKTGFFNTISFITDGFVTIGDKGVIAFGQIVAVVRSLPNIVAQNFQNIRQEAFDLVTSFTGIGDIITDVLSFRDPTESIQNFKASFQKELGDVRQAAGEIAQEIVNVAQASADATQAFIDDSRAGAVASAALEEKKKENKLIAEERERQSQEDREAAEKAAERRLALVIKNEETLTAFIKKERETRILNELQGLAREEERIRQKYANEIALAQENSELLKQVEALRDQELADARLQAEQTLQERLRELREEQDALSEELAFEKELEAAETQIEKEELRLERARELALEELKILEEAELAKVEAVDGAEQLKQEIRKKFALEGERLNVQFDKQERQLRSDQVQWTELTENQKLNSITSALAVAADAFNEGSAAWKAAKIAETLIATYQGAQNAFTSLAPIPIVGPALGTAAAGLAVVAGLQRVQTISNTKIERINKPRGFYDGGHTGSRSYGRDHQGEVAGVVHTNEWVAPEVMTRDPKYANVLGWLEGERKRKVHGYMDGGVVTPTGPIDSGFPPPVTLPTNDDLSRAILTLNSLLASGINANVQIGYPEAEAIGGLQNDINQRAASSNLAG